MGLINRIKGHLHEATKSSALVAHLTGKHPRSSHWPAVEHAFRKEHSSCAACGGGLRLQVHHVHPFHLKPDLELDPTNLIALCMGPNECHLLIGHGDDFKAWNPNARTDAAMSRHNAASRPEAIARARKNRRYDDGE